jgi:hypothetical protein
MNPVGFFAFPSSPRSVPESIAAAAADINKLGIVDLKNWDELRIGGKWIIDEVCTAIDEAAFVCADLTGYNANVMFEIGYAIGKNKRVWFAIDDSYSETKAAEKQMEFLTPIGARRYQNSRTLMDAFLSDQPFLDLDETLFARFIEPNLAWRIVGDSVLYLKSRHDTDASIQISASFQRSSMRTVIDDPNESSAQSLSWYGQNVYSAVGVCAHLTNPNREGAALVNARYALVCGMAKAMGRQLLIIGEEANILAPLDYRDVVRNYTSAKDAGRLADAWLTPVEEIAKRRREELTQIEDQRRRAVDLRVLYAGLGEYVAENDAGLVDDYFVDTSAYDAALQGSQTIFVGRKGTGKTANLIKLRAELSRSRKNIVVTIKPVGYELEGLVSLFRRLQSRDDKGYVVATLWKYLLLAETANAVSADLRDRRDAGVPPTADEVRLDEYLDANAWLKDDFAVRLDRAITQLLARISEEDERGLAEILHSEDLRVLRDLVAGALRGRERVAILIDNLDKAWTKSADVVQLSDFLLELLVVAGKLASELAKATHAPRQFAVTTTVFLRSDIYNKVREVAREPDKLPVHRMRWDDRELLMRVVDQRLLATSAEPVAAAELWQRFFCATVRGVDTRSYFATRILPRPRDLIYFVKAALNVAVNRARSVVEERDVLDAERQYSEYALDSVKVENGITLPELESVLYEFAGKASILAENDVAETITAAGIPEDRTREVGDHLVALTFLGRETAFGRFAFCYDAQEDKRNRALAEHYQRTSGAKARYQIGSAFHSFLEIAHDDLSVSSV